MSDYQIFDAHSHDGLEALEGSRPFLMARQGASTVAVHNGKPSINGNPLMQIRTARGLVVNSLLRKDEWELLDNAVVEAARQRLNGIADLRRLGLVQNLGGLGTLISQWNQASEMSAANVSITGQAPGDRDRVDYQLAGVPVPVIFKDYVIGRRQLEASRRLGSGIDTSHAFAAARVVSEGIENMLFNGSSVVLNGNAIYGYTTHPDRFTDTAANVGGGDWGTIGNIVSTVLGAITQLNLQSHYGPYGIYVANTQYIQALETYTDGSGQTALARVEMLPNISFMKPSDWLADGVMVMVQLTPDTVDLGEAQGLTNLEWTSGDNLTGYFKVMQVAVPRIKSDHAGNSGVAHITGC